MKFEQDQLAKIKLTTTGILGLQYEAALAQAAKLKLGGEVAITQLVGGKHKIFAGLEFGDCD